MQRVLVTGGEGAFGNIVSNALRSRGYDVVCGTRRSVTHVGLHQIDITDSLSVNAAIQAIKPAAVIHLAATFANDYDEAYATNVLGGKNILSAVKESGLSTRVILAGSAAEYGLVAPEENPIRVDRVLRPVSTYGLTKSWQTNYGLMCAHQGMDVIVARIFNLDGPGLSEALFVGRITRQIHEVVTGVRERIQVGPLSAVRDYISTDEAASQLINIMERGRSGLVYHVASGQPIKMRDLLQKHLDAAGLNFGIVDEAAALSLRTGYDVPAIYADISRTSELTDK